MTGVKLSHHESLVDGGFVPVLQENYFFYIHKNKSFFSSNQRLKFQ